MHRRSSAAVGVALFGLLVEAGCGYDIASGPLSGKLGGKPWTVATAETNAALTTDNFWVDMYGQTLPSCTGGSPNGSRMLFAVPMRVGDYELGIALTATFVIDDNGTWRNFIATSGRLKVDAITTNAITGGAHVDFDSDNEVNGKFQVTLCP